MPARATLAEFEAGKRAPYDRTLADIRSALEAAGVEFTNGDASGVRLLAGAVSSRNRKDRLSLSDRVSELEEELSATSEMLNAQEAAIKTLVQILQRVMGASQYADAAEPEIDSWASIYEAHPGIVAELRDLLDLRLPPGEAAENDDR